MLNPQMILNQMLANNPQAQQAFNMLRGKSPAELERMARNMAKERGLDLDNMIRQFTGHR